MSRDHIDCFIVGNNQMDFGEYVNAIQRMGEESGAYKDMRPSFFNENGRALSCSDYYNDKYRNETRFSPISYNNLFSATISYLGTYLVRNGFTFDYVNSFQEEKAKLAHAIRNSSIGVIAITTTYYVSVMPVLEIVRFIRSLDANVRIVVGGPFVATQSKIQDTSSFKYLLSMLGADYYIISAQGERTLVHLLHALKTGEPIHSIHNVAYKHDEEFHVGELRKENNDLSENMVDWGLFRKDLEERKTRMVMVRSATSCPFACEFCSFPAHAGDYRYVAPSLLLEELEQINSIPTINSVTFIDDTFNVPLKRFKEILRILCEKRFRFKWNCNFRSQYADEEAIALMKSSGCEGVFLGIESGSDTILKNMNKNATTNDYRRGISMLKAQGILTYGSFIVGFPGENDETIAETIEFIKETKLDFFRAQLWYYDTMTPIHKKASMYGLQNSQFEWVHNSMNSKEAIKWVDYLHRNIHSSVWLPQNNFDFPSLFNLLSRGWSMDQIKQMLSSFNTIVRRELEAENEAAQVPDSLFDKATFAF